MRLIFGLVLIAGVLLAGFAVYTVSRQQQAMQSEVARLKAELENSESIATVEVAVATQDLRFGERLDPDDVEMVIWPKASLPENGFTALADLLGDDDDDFRTVVRAMEPNEPILQSKVTNFGESAGMAARLGPGVRAFTIRVDLATGVSGFLTPGDRVDIYWTGRAGRQPITRLILENVELIAIDQLSDTDQNRPIVARTVTLAVSPQRVGFLAQAQASGKLTLALRGAEDEDTMEETIEVDQMMIMGREAEEEAAPEEECYLRLRRGTEIVLEKIDCEDE
ncbi:MAG: Flp pilus assembly protein CpaB [Pseudomonadota bacterium]